MKLFSDIFNQLKNMEPSQRKNIFLVGKLFFITMLSYPLVRSAADSLFLQDYGAKKSPEVWLYSIIGLCISIGIYNRFQSRLGIHKLFRFTVLFTLLIFLFGQWFFRGGHTWMAYPIFIWKEVHIVLLIHGLLGYFNTLVDEKTAKLLYGSLGAAGGFAGVLGGQLTVFLTQYMETTSVLMTGALILLVCIPLSQWLQRVNIVTQEKEDLKLSSPLKAVKSKWQYIFLLAGVVIITQFIINIVNFEFNIYAGANYSSRISKTEFFGNVYTFINGINLVTQLLIIPVIFRFFSNRSIHLGIPSLYFTILLVTVFFPLGMGIWGITACFCLFKGFDYSLFSTTKEILYFPLSLSEKYGAKYIIDIVVYRGGKGLVSLFLIFMQDLAVLHTLLIVLLIAWWCSIWLLFKAQKKYFLA